MPASRHRQRPRFSVESVHGPVLGPAAQAQLALTSGDLPLTTCRLSAPIVQLVNATPMCISEPERTGLLN